MKYLKKSLAGFIVFSILWTVPDIGAYQALAQIAPNSGGAKSGAISKGVAVQTGNISTSLLNFKFSPNYFNGTNFFQPLSPQVINSPSKTSVPSAFLQNVLKVRSYLVPVSPSLGTLGKQVRQLQAAQREGFSGGSIETSASFLNLNRFFDKEGSLKNQAVVPVKPGGSVGSMDPDVEAKQAADLKEYFKEKGIEAQVELYADVPRGVLSSSNIVSVSAGELRQEAVAVAKKVYKVFSEISSKDQFSWLRGKVWEIKVIGTDGFPIVTYRSRIPYSEQAVAVGKKQAKEIVKEIPPITVYSTVGEVLPFPGAFDVFKGYDGVMVGEVIKDGSLTLYNRSGVAAQKNKAHPQDYYFVLKDPDVEQPIAPTEVVKDGKGLKSRVSPVVPLAIGVLLGLTFSSSLTVTIPAVIVGLIMFVFGGAALSQAEKLGRKRVFGASLMVMGLGLIGFGVGGIFGFIIHSLLSNPHAASAAAATFSAATTVAEPPEAGVLTLVGIVLGLIIGGFGGSKIYDKLRRSRPPDNLVASALVFFSAVMGGLVLGLLGYHLEQNVLHSAAALGTPGVSLAVLSFMGSIRDPASSIQTKPNAGGSKLFPALGLLAATIMIFTVVPKISLAWQIPIALTVVVALQVVGFALRARVQRMDSLRQIASDIQKMEGVTSVSVGSFVAPTLEINLDGTVSPEEIEESLSQKYGDLKKYAPVYSVLSPNPQELRNIKNAVAEAAWDVLAFAAYRSVSDVAEIHRQLKESIPLEVTRVEKTYSDTPDIIANIKQVQEKISQIIDRLYRESTSVEEFKSELLTLSNKIKAWANTPTSKPDVLMKTLDGMLVSKPAPLLAAFLPLLVGTIAPLGGTVIGSFVGAFLVAVGARIWTKRAYEGNPPDIQVTLMTAFGAVMGAVVGGFAGHHVITAASFLPILLAITGTISGFTLGRLITGWSYPNIWVMLILALLGGVSGALI